jgi:serine/threonine protein kinase
MAEVHSATLTEDDRRQVQTALADFERNWTAQKLAEMLPKLPPSDHSLRRVILLGLVRIDLFRQWQAGRRITVEEYLAIAPELGTPANPPLDLLQSEVDARRMVGAPLDMADFQRRFPGQAEALRTMLEPTLAGAGPSVEGAETVNQPPSVAPRAGLPHQLPCAFGRYSLLRVLGQGGMGAVYLAHDESLDRQVALKIPLIRPNDGPDVMPRFHREARAAATLHHANICPVYDVGEIAGTPYLTMAFIEGQSLSDFIKGKKQMPQREAAQLVRRVAMAMHEAHKKGVIHRDLKPSNIHITPEGEPVIMDFGIARRLDREGERLTRTGQLIGTPEFMSPEQARGNVEGTGPLSDVYSLGVILYRLLAGRVPFEGDLLDVLLRLTTESPRPPSQFRPDLDPRLEAACLKAMARKPEDRFDSMPDFAAALDAFLASPPPEVSPRSPTASDQNPVKMESPSLPPHTILPQTMAPASVVAAQPAVEPLSEPTSRETSATQPLPPPRPPRPPSNRGNLVVGLFLLVGIVGAGAYWLLNRPGLPLPTGVASATQPSVPASRATTADTKPETKLETKPETKPADTPSLLKQAQRAFADKEYNRAIQLCTEVLTREPANAVVALAIRGQAYLGVDNPEQAIKDLTAVIDKDATNGTVLAGRAKAQLQLKKYDAAIDDARAALKLDRSLQLDPLLLQAYRARGLRLLENKAYPQAVAALTEAIQLDPKDPALRKQRGEAYANQRQFDDAVQDFRQAVERNPDDVRNWSQYLHALLGQNDLASYRNKCKEMYGQFAKSEDASTLNLAAWLGALVPNAVDDPRAPVQFAETASKKSDEKNDLIYRNTLAAALYRAGETERAARHLEAMAKLREERKDQRGNVTDWIFLGLAYNKLADPQAREQLEKAIRGIDQESALPTCTWNRRVELEFLRKEVEGVLKKMKG